jgi:hypothetical protein
MPSRNRLKAIFLLGLVWILDLPATANAQEPVDVELILAVDVSGSMQYAELREQRDGYVAAFRSREVIRAIGQGAYGRVAVMYVEWARADLKKVIVPWTIIDSAEISNGFSDRLAAAEIGNMRNTSITGAIQYGAAAFEANGYVGDRRVIDISGDGPNNQGGLVTIARDEATSSGITINGLPLMVQPWLAGLAFGASGLDDYYRDCVIGGPGAFMIPVASWEEFPEAVRRKLVLELSGVMPGRPTILRAQFTDEAKSDCGIGEKLRRINEF